MRFILVAHQWHVHSQGFTVKEVGVNNEKDAHIEGVILKDSIEDNFSKTAVNVIAVEDREVLVNRHLTLMERITGKLRL